MAAHGEAERASERLRREAEPDWSAAVGHRFVHELAAGTIDPAVMRRYLVQDYQFVDAFVVLLGATIHAAPGYAQRLALGRFLGLVVSSENTYFERSFDELGVPAQERVRPRLAPPTSGFRALMHEAAGSGDYGSMVAVLTVAEWLYLAWAAPLAGRAPDWFVLREWVDLHSGEDFEAWVGFLRDELDHAFDAGDATARERVAVRFRRAVALERAFFDAAYEA
jgi:thiaminase/transcriptional activator TenA